MSTPRTPLADRLWPKFDRRDPDECWPWTGAKDSNGYGHVLVAGKRGRMIQAHRAVYEALVGPIPEGLVIDHLCRVPACVNPKHLEPVTQRENQNRGIRGPQPACCHGHPFTPENTYHRRDKVGRNCRTCSRANHQRRNAMAGAASHHG